MRDLLLNRDRPPQHEARLPVISYDQVLGKQIIMNYRQFRWKEVADYLQAAFVTEESRNQMS